MSVEKTILVAGTYDTKNDELAYLAKVIRGQGGKVLSMDVSVLGDPAQATDVSKHAVAQAGGSSIQMAIDSGDENHAMQIMAQGAAASVRALYRDGKIDGVIVLGWHDGHRSGAGSVRGAAGWRAEIYRLDRGVFTAVAA